MMTRDVMSPAVRRFGPVALLPLALAACDANARTATRTDAAHTTGGHVTGTAAAYSAGAGGAATTASVAGGLTIGEGNPDQGFLRRLVAQQESLTFAIDRLLPQLRSPVALAQAYTVRDRTAIEYQESVGLLRDWFAETHDADRVPRSDGDLKPAAYRAAMREGAGALARAPQATAPGALQFQGGARDTAYDAARAQAPGASVQSGVDRTATAAEAQGRAQDDAGIAATAPGDASGMTVGADPESALRELLVAHHRRTLALTEAYWPHMVQAQPRALAVAQHRQSRLELQALLARDSTGAPAPSGEDPRVPLSGVPNAGLDDAPDSRNRQTVPQSSQSPNAPAPAPPAATPSVPARPPATRTP